MADPIVGIVNGVPTSGTGNITTLGQTLVDGANATLGLTTAAAVTTDATGTLQQYLRGLVKLFTTATFKAASTAPLATDPALVVSISPNSVNPNGSKTSANSAPVVIASDQASIPVASTLSAETTKVIGTVNVAAAQNITPVDQYATHKEVGASATATVLGATGAIGDYLAYVTVFPGTAGCGVVTILDAAATVGTFAGGGTTALPSLVPFTIQIGAFCTGAGWKITTGANVTVTAVGKFT